MARQRADLLGKLIIHAVDAVLVLGFAAFDAAAAVTQGTQGLAGIRIVAHLLRQDVPGPLQGFLGCGDALFLIDEGQSQILGRAGFDVLHQQLKGQGFQSLFFGNGGTGAPLGPEGPINVLQLGQSGGSGQLGADLLGQVALLGQGVLNFGAALVQAPQVLEAFIQLPQYLIVQGAGKLLTVAGNEGNGVTIVNQFENILALGHRQVKFLTKNRFDVQIPSSFRGSIFGGMIIPRCGGFCQQKSCKH